MTEPIALKYRAFLSYSHADTAWAKWLHRSLERFQIDKDLVGRTTSVGPVPKTLRPIFRDREEFTGGHRLSDATITAIDRSAALIVLCSPASAKSPYVNEEVRLFKSRHPDRPVVPVIIEGSPPDNFPDALRHSIAIDGTVTDQPVTLLASDVRETGDGKHLALSKIIAGLTGVETDEIVRRAERDRRKTLRNWIAGLSTVILALAGLTTWAEFNRREAIVQQQEAQRNFALAKQAVDGLTRDIARDLADIEGMQIKTIAHILDRVRSVVDKLSQSAPDNPELLSSREEMLIEIGNTLWSKGDAEGAGKAYQEALVIAERLTSLDPSQPLRKIAICDLLRKQSGLLRYRGDHSAAIKKLMQCLKIAEPIAQQYPDKKIYKFSLAAIYNEMGQSTDAAGALEWHKKALPLFEDLVTEYPTSNEILFQLSLVEISIAKGLSNRGEDLSALEHYKKALDINQKLAAADPTDTTYQDGLATSLTNVGVISERQGNHSAYVDTLRKKISLYEHLIRIDPQKIALQDDLGGAYMALGDAVAESDKAEALALFRKCASTWRRAADLSPSNPNYWFRSGVCHQRISHHLKAQGDNMGAYDEFKTAAKIIREAAALHPESDWWQDTLSKSFSEQADWLVERGDKDGALEASQTSFAIRERLANSADNLDEDSINVRKHHLAQAYLSVGDTNKAFKMHAEAMNAYGKSLDILKALAANWSKDKSSILKEIVIVDVSIAKALVQDNKYDLAMDAYRETLKQIVFIENFERKDDTGLLDQNTTRKFARDMHLGVLLEMAQLDVKMTRFAEAEQLATERLALVENSGSKSEIANTLGDLSWFLLFRSKFEEAEMKSRKAVMLDRGNIGFLESNLAHALMFLGRLDEARTIYARNRGLKINNESWGNTIVNDFNQLRAAGLTHPDMGRIELLLRQPQ